MRMMTTAATIAAVLVSAGAAMATTAVPRTTANATPSATQRGQHASNQDILDARRHVERAIDTLGRDANDYGGHRESAVDDLGLARQYLKQAIQFERDHHGNRGGNGSPIPI